MYSIFLKFAITSFFISIFFSLHEKLIEHFYFVFCLTMVLALAHKKIIHKRSKKFLRYWSDRLARIDPAW